MAGAPAAPVKASGKGPRRNGVHTDMTPMVDVAFLLLTFFMLTTVFSRPQALEITLPESEAPVEIAESNVFTIRVGADGAPTWALGPSAPERTTWDDLQTTLARAAAANDRLVTVIKVDRESPYSAAVDALDELQSAGVTRFAIAPMTDADRALLGAPAPASDDA